VIPQLEKGDAGQPCKKERIAEPAIAKQQASYKSGTEVGAPCAVR